MRGRVQRDSESCRNSQRSGNHHTWSVLQLATSDKTVAVDDYIHSPLASSITTSPTGDSFFKDGRKISVGDSALFKRSKDSSPVIGLIHWLTSDKETNLQIGVNWLYRSSELKLQKGPVVESAPNEIFYSFCKDEISAASLLHPCKVAYLPRGVELPTGTSSYVCRRVYDIANKSLWWLTDQDYVNEQKEEIENLLLKTRIEMYATPNPGGRSPKQANGPTSTSELKAASDSGQNSGTSHPSQTRGRKRERVNHGADPAKRERSTRTDEGDSGQCRPESKLKYEIAQITEKGGIVDVEGVESIVQLMQPDCMERKIDLVSRVMLVNVMASTDKVACLDKFVQRKGLLVLDKWLQDIHKGKIGYGNVKDGDKSVEEFLLVLLLVLDKLPVNLRALQMCNIGRSVNHLRSHKNVEIQRKARTLVDTWKKRVEAEMKNMDAKFGSIKAVSSWPSKSQIPDASHAGSKTPNGSDVSMKNTITQNSASKGASLRSSRGESSTKHAISSPGSVKPASSLTVEKENQPKTFEGSTADSLQNREDMSSSSSQSHNYGQTSSPKEDVKSSTSCSETVNNVSNSTRKRKICGSPGISVTDTQKETHSSRSSGQKITALEKLSHSALTSERVVEGSISNVNNHKLIVEIPNLVRSPSQGVNRGWIEDPTLVSDQTSLLVSKQELPQKFQCSAVLEGAESPEANEEKSMTSEDSKRIIEEPISSPSKFEKFHSSSFSPMNALVESCARYSEATSSLSLEDDVGMNLLASVAAGEMSRSNLVSPTNSTERNILTAEELCKKDGTENKSFLENSSSYDGNKHSVHCPFIPVEDVPAGEDTKDFCSSSTVLRSNGKLQQEANDKSNEKIDHSSSALPIRMENVSDGMSHKGVNDEKTSSSIGIDVMVMKDENRTDNLSNDERKPMVSSEGSIPLDKSDCSKFVNEGLNRPRILLQKLRELVKSEFGDRVKNGKLSQTECNQKSVSKADDATKTGAPGDLDAESCMRKSEHLNFDHEVERNAVGECHGATVLCSPSRDLQGHLEETIVENWEMSRCPISKYHNGLKEAELVVVDPTGIPLDEVDKRVSSPSLATSRETYPRPKIMFDLNEDLNPDEGKCGESTKTLYTSTTGQMNNSLPFASVAIAAAAKGSFVPPEELLRGKMELGWKGSAATSAFQPAEPRKAFEMPLGPSWSAPDASASKHNRISLDIDLNVPDEGVVEEMVSRDSASAIYLATHSSSTSAALLNERSNFMPSAVMDLDLNRLDETNDIGLYYTRSNQNGVGPNDLHIRKDFDLNSGPVVDDASIDQISVKQLVNGGVTSHLPPAGIRMSSVGLSSFSSWNHPGSAYSTITIPSMLPDRAEQPFPVFPPGGSQRIYGSANVTPFNPDVFRGSVLSSSPAAVPFASSPFQFPVVPLGTSYPLPAATFPVGATSYSDSSPGVRIFAPRVNSKYLGPIGSLSPQF